jgi:hypothetical protein
MHAHRVNAPRKLVSEEIFGEVEYFIVHKHKESERMFAYVRKIDKYEEDNYGQIYFNKFGSFQFIEVIGIDRCVGFFRIENLFYILDRERI